MGSYEAGGGVVCCGRVPVFGDQAQMKIENSIRDLKQVYGPSMRHHEAYGFDFIEGTYDIMERTISHRRPYNILMALHGRMGGFFYVKGSVGHVFLGLKSVCLS